jgi:hypothetical protein
MNIAVEFSPLSVLQSVLGLCLGFLISTHAFGATFFDVQVKPSKGNTVYA